MKWQSRTGFFEGFPDRGGVQALARFQVAGRLVEHPLTAHDLLDHQQASGVEDHGGDRDVRPEKRSVRMVRMPAVRIFRHFHGENGT